MKIAYLNAYFQDSNVSGGNAHVGQFIQNVLALGHEIWTMPNHGHPLVHYLPARRLERTLALRKMDVVYIRITYKVPDYCRWATFPYKQLLGSPIFVWEFNTVPEYGLLRGYSNLDVLRNIQEMIIPRRCRLTERPKTVAFSK